MVPKAPPLSATSTSYSVESEISSLEDFSSPESSFFTYCNEIDERLSKPIFELSLPTVLEASFTVPACFFGLIPCVVLGPIILGILGFGANESLTSERIWVVKSLVTILSVIFLIAWALFLRGNRWVLPKFLGKKVLYVLAVPWSMGILNWGVYTGDGDSSARDRIFSSKVYSMWLWPWAVLAVLCLKKWSKRLRPCLKCTRDFIKEKKSFPAIPIMLSNTQGDESFPSGDATTAAAFAIPLAYIESSTHFVLFGWSISSTVLAAYAIVFVTCSGRVYFLAHHVCDVVAGTAISFAIHLVSTCMGLGVYDMKWWYPLAANAVVTAHAKWKMERILNLESKKLKA